MKSFPLELISFLRQMTTDSEQVRERAPFRSRLLRISDYANGMSFNNTDISVWPSLHLRWVKLLIINFPREEHTKHK